MNKDQMGDKPAFPLEMLLISENEAEIQRERFLVAKGIIAAIENEEEDTLAGWWCVLNAREWPNDIGLQKPIQEYWGAIFAMRIIESTLAKRCRFGWKKLIRLSWSCYEHEKG